MKTEFDPMILGDIPPMGDIPPKIREAAWLVSNWMQMQGHHEWCLGPICSRNLNYKERMKTCSGCGGVMSCKALREVVSMLWGELKGPVASVGIRVIHGAPHEGGMVIFEARGERGWHGFRVSMDDLFAEGDRFTPNSRIRAVCNMVTAEESIH